MTDPTRKQETGRGLADALDTASANGHIPQLRPIGAAATAAGLARRAGEARTTADSLAARGVGAIAISVVDNAGIARVTAVPVTGLEHATRWGAALSPAYGLAAEGETFTSGSAADGPSGGLRLMPDVAALRTIAAQPGWAWAPGDQYTQDGRVSGCCQRSFTRRMTDLAALRGLEIRVGIEIGWFLGRDEHGEVIPAHDGPGYSLAALAGLVGYAGALFTALARSGVRTGQLHPGCAPGQLELSLPPAEPVEAADLTVLARHTIRAHSASHGWRASFSPAVPPAQAGNGGHLHVSTWRGGRNLLAGGNGPHGMTADGESFAAGILAELPALTAVGAPSAASYLPPRPSRWAGSGACRGRENREAAMRFITGMTGSQPDAANIEIRCLDQAANPYLAIGSVIAAGLAGMERRRRLPAETTGDPVTSVSQARRAGRLPQSLDEAVAALRQSEVIPAAMGPVLHDAFTAAREAESRAFQGQDPETIAAAHRWRY
jgi:glutamine synthetase